MAEQKVYVCPNCGAKTTNTENCEHCGSLLVRFVEKGIDISNTPYTTDSLVLPGLIKELETNLKLQEKYRGRNVDTEISWHDNTGKEKWLFISNYWDDEEEINDISDNTISQKPQLILNFQLCYYNEIKDGELAIKNNKNQDALLMSFTQLKAYSLFIFKDHEGYEDDDFYTKDFYINCGQDTEGAARLASDILMKVNGLFPSDNYIIVTSYRDENDDDIEVSKFVNNRQDIIDSDIFISSVKNLAIQALTNVAEIRNKAEKGDAKSCTQMGMIHLLGINTPIDFKKASYYLGNKSLANDSDANRLLGFIAECDGYYSLAFKMYAKAAEASGNQAKKPFVNKALAERENLQAYLKKLGISGSLLNKVISTVLTEYVKGGESKLDASRKLAMICDDEESCLDAAQALYDAGDYHSAMRWLQKGKISESNALYSSIKKKLIDIKSTLNLTTTLEVIEIEGNSFLANEATPSYAGIKHLCDEMALICKKAWVDIVSPEIEAFKNKWEEDEQERIRKEEEEKRQRLLQLEAEEKARKKKRMKIIMHSIAVIVLFVWGYSSIHEIGGAIVFVIFCYLFFYLPYFFIRRMYKNRKDRNKTS